MELETQNQVSGNQLKRQEEEIKRLTEQLEGFDMKVKEMTAKCRDHLNKYTDLESKVIQLVLSLKSVVRNNWIHNSSWLLKRHLLFSDER